MYSLLEIPKDSSSSSSCFWCCCVNCRRGRARHAESQALPRLVPLPKRFFMPFTKKSCNKSQGAPDSTDRTFLPLIFCLSFLLPLSLSVCFDLYLFDVKK